MNVRTAIDFAILESAGAMHVPDLGLLNQTEWLGGVLWSRMSDLEPPPSLVKCLGATVAGSIFALLGMLLENIRGRKKKQGISREELGKLIPKRSRAASMPDSVSQTRTGSDAVGEGSSPIPAKTCGGHSSNSRTEVRSRSGNKQHSGTASAPATPSPGVARTAHRTANNVERSPVSAASPSSFARTTSVPWRPSPKQDSSITRSNSTPMAKSASTPTRLAPAALTFGGRVLSELEQMERQVKVLLNKMTREKFNTLYDQIHDCCTSGSFGEADRAEIVEVVARETFAMATRQHNFVDLYADLCARLHGDLEREKAPVNFKRVLLDQCQQSFKSYLEPPQIDTLLDYEEQYEQLVKYKTKMLGNVKLIGCLLRRAMLSPKIIFHCTDELLSIGSAESLETLCVFLDTIGTTFDSAEWQGRPRLEEVFTRVELLAEDARQNSRIRCLLKDLLDKRKSSWRDFSGRPKARAA